MVALETNRGKIVIQLNAEKAPISVENFLGYVEEGYYDGLIFHRVINNFMIQGGGFTPDMTKKTPSQPTIQNEADNGLDNKVGSIAMARTNAPHSASSQFFINTKDNGFLNHTAKTSQGWGYAVFGQVVEGMDIVGQISVTRTARKGSYSDVPVDPVVIEKAYLVE